MQRESCQGCSQAHDCKKIYQQLGRTEGPSVARSVVIAFALPITVFVTGLGLCQWLLAGRVEQPAQSAIAVIPATAVTIAMVWALNLVAKRRNRTDDIRNGQP